MTPVNLAVVSLIGGKDKSGGHTQSSGQDLNSYLQVDRISQGDDNSIKSEPCKAKHVLTPEELPGGLPAQLRTPQLQRVKEVDRLRSHFITSPDMWQIEKTGR